MPRKKTTRRPATKNDDAMIGHLAVGMADLNQRVGSLENAALIASQNFEAPRDKSKEVAALVGLWIDRQKAEGATTVDLRRVDDVRAGIELALT